MILRQEDEWLLGSNFFRLTIDESLLKLLEVQGFSLGTWRDLIEDSQCRYVLDYTWTMSEGDSFGYIKLLSGEKADLHSIDYVYRAVLAQEERERQQASSEG